MSAMGEHDSRKGGSLRALLCLWTFSAAFPLLSAEPEAGTGSAFLGGEDDPSMPKMPQLGAAERQALQMECQQDVQDFIQRNSDMVKKHGAGPVSNPDDMLFFLHVPRTAGRTFFSCFLKPAQPPSKRCAKSYDALRLNVSMSGCGLLSSHDDYSVSQFLPETSAIITQVRDPVQRVLSAYEFSIEVASRELKRPANKPPPPPGKVNTRNVWPWSLLVPWMEADMRARLMRLQQYKKDNYEEVDAIAKSSFVKVENSKTGNVYYHNAATNRSVWKLGPSDTEVPPLDPYNNPGTMPLREFIEHPLVRDTIHNGATLQTLGLTNYSHLAAAPKLRQCVEGLPNAKEAMTKAALARLGTMFHVGTTDQLVESVTSVAAALGLKLNGPSWKSNADGAFSYDDAKEGATTADPKGEASTAAGNAADAQADEKAQYLARIKELTEEMEEKGRALRKTQAGMRTAQHKSQTVPLVPAKLQTRSTEGADGCAKSEMEEHRDAATRLQREIDAIKAQVADMQVKLVKLKTPAPLLHTSAAKQIKNDDSFKTAMNLAQSYHRCVAASRAKNAKRWVPLGNIRMLDGRTFKYNDAARKRINPAIIKRIRELNSMDVRLYALAQKMLKDARESQEAAGILEELPPPPPGLQAMEPPPFPHLPPKEADAGDDGPHVDAEGTDPQLGKPGAAAPQGAHSTSASKDAPYRHVGVGLEGQRQQQGPQRQRPGPKEAGGGPGLNRAPRGPEAKGQRRRRPNPEAVVDAHPVRDEL